MGLVQRISAIFKAKASRAVEAAEDPRETLDYSYERQLEMLQKVRRGLADVATSRKRVELQAQQLEGSSAKLEDQARQAVAQNREDLAREALSRRAAIDSQLTDLKAQHEHLRNEENKLSDAARRLQAKIEAFRVRKETVKATYTAAEAQTKIHEAVTGISEEMSDIGMAMQRAQDRTERMRARAGALEEMVSSGALEDLSQPSDSIQAELDRGTVPSVELELAKIKNELGRGAEPKAIQAGSTGTGGEQS